MSEAATLGALWRAMAPCVTASVAAPSVGEIAAAADAAGEARGRAGERAALAPLRAALAAAERAMASALAVDADALQPLFVDLVTRVARAVVEVELRTAPDAVARLVAAALASIEIDGDPVVHLSASDAALLDTPLVVVVDPALAPGSIRVETPRHVVAASLEARLAEIVAAL
jgi:flagellar biosynthesis/type III secretory pathway protein FliH